LIIRVMTDEDSYAHSLPGRPVEEWKKLPDHLAAVAKRAACFAAPFGWAGAARVAGALHDIGKCSVEFAEYIKRCSAGEEGLRGPDHSTAGARIAEKTYPFPFGRFLSHIIAGHHAGTGGKPVVWLTADQHTFHHAKHPDKKMRKPDAVLLTILINWKEPKLRHYMSWLDPRKK
jgi:CRISPR-associated endonuclease Cas3-HD